MSEQIATLESNFKEEGAAQSPEVLLPFLVHWAVEGSIGASTDMLSPDTDTWRNDTEDADT